MPNLHSITGKKILLPQSSNGKMACRLEPPIKSSRLAPSWGCRPEPVPCDLKADSQDWLKSSLDFLAQLLLGSSQ